MIRGTNGAAYSFASVSAFLIILSATNISGDGISDWVAGLMLVGGSACGAFGLYIWKGDY